MFVGPVAVIADIIGAAKEVGIVSAQHRADFSFGPDVELALDTFAVGVEAGRECAALGAHFAPDPGDDIGGGSAEDIFSGLRESEGEEVEQLGIVVEHFLEMRDQPSLVNRIAGKAATQMVMDAARPDASERQQHEVVETRFAHPVAGAPEQLEQRRVGEFRRSLDAAVDHIHHFGQARRIAVDERQRDLARCRRAFGIAESVAQRFDIGPDALGMRMVDVGDLLQNRAEARPSITGLLGEIGAAPERLAVRRQKHRQRPAARLTHRMQRGHVDLVDVRALFAIDLDGDEQIIHERGSIAVLEALVRHHMAPMARRIADRQQDRLVRPFRLRQRVFAPRAPVDRIVLVLKKIGARGPAEFIFGHIATPQLSSMTL